MELINENWCSTEDGFRLYRLPLADMLSSEEIVDTGISRLNDRDVQSYFDDWHLYCVGEETYSLVKLREQEHDYVPGFADRDYPGVTVSFIPFDIAVLTALPRGAGAEAPEMQAFVEEFRRVTEYSGQHHGETLQRYFSQESAEGPYLIARTYVEKLMALTRDGELPFPDGMLDPPRRLVDGLILLNEKAGRAVCDFEAKCLRAADPSAPTREEACAFLAAHTGNLSFNSFAAEVKFHADALVSWENKLPHVGRTKWYASAIRADMMVEKDGPIRRLFFDDYHHMDGRSVTAQRRLHGDR